MSNDTNDQSPTIEQMVVVHDGRVITFVNKFLLDQMAAELRFTTSRMELYKREMEARDERIRELIREYSSKV